MLDVIKVKLDFKKLWKRWGLGVNWLGILLLLIVYLTYYFHSSEFERVKIGYSVGDSYHQYIQSMVKEAVKLNDFETARYVIGQAYNSLNITELKQINKIAYPEIQMNRFLDEFSSYVSFHPLSMQTLAIKASYLVQLGDNDDAGEVLGQMQELNPNELELIGGFERSMAVEN